MRHSNSGRKFSRSPSHRKALFMNLAKALLQHGRIVTTEAKAKDLRTVIEPLITLAKRNDLHARRLAYKQLNDHKIVKYLFDEIGPLFLETPGGYTRVLKLAKHRKGDNAPMAIIEFTRKKGETPESRPEKKRAAPAAEASSAEAVKTETTKPDTQATVKPATGADQKETPAEATPSVEAKSAEGAEAAKSAPSDAENEKAGD